MRSCLGQFCEVSVTDSLHADIEVLMIMPIKTCPVPEDEEEHLLVEQEIRGYIRGPIQYA
jgi:hypothetical protein